MREVAPRSDLLALTVSLVVSSQPPYILPSLQPQHTAQHQLNSSIYLHHQESSRSSCVQQQRGCSEEISYFEFELKQGFGSHPSAFLFLPPPTLWHSTRLASAHLHAAVKIIAAAQTKPNGGLREPLARS